MLHPLPDAVTDRQAAVLEPAAVALHGLRSGRVRAGNTVAVAGAGPIGLLIAQLAPVAGARRVVVSDVSEVRLGYRDIHPDLIGMIASGLFDPSRIVTRDVPLTDAMTDGLERLRTHGDDVKILIHPQAKGEPS
ncbi:hypothetical protein C8J32_10765 [Rhizobium sp. PP-CC-3A-592]|nr:hypothetical protein C8J32_10765 [Rhizobium sp. PP-CC-3A-592]